MSFDREETLKKAEKLLRQGRLDAAIIEYARIVDEQPRDWATTNTLGDLYVRAGQIDNAVGQYSRVAEHFHHEGFYSKAAALYKKLLKLNPQDETSQLSLADVSQKQGLLADAKAHLNAIASRRRERGDRAGAAEIVVRLGAVDPTDFDARLAGARASIELGQRDAAGVQLHGIYDDLAEKGRQSEATGVLREAIRLNPDDRHARGLLAKAAVAAGDVESARGVLDRETAGDDPQLQLALVELEVKAGRVDRIRDVVSALLANSGDHRQRILDLAWSTAEVNREAGYILAEAVVDAVCGAKDYDEAAKIVHEFIARVPEHVPALLRLIEVCVDGGLEATMYQAQARLADVYLNAGRATEARVIAEDLVACEPWERAHLDRFRRALVMLKVSDPDTVIAERLSGQTPFVAKDMFAPDPPVAVAAEESSSHGVSAANPPSERDLAGELSPAGAATPHSTGTDRAHGDTEQPETLEQVFKDFRSQVQGTDQAVQNMTLARTYLDMGMPDEAVGCLEAAAKAPRFRFEAASLLARICRDRGDSVRAIDWFERAAEAPAPTVDEGRALLYDLGALFEATGETSRALAIFLELQSDAGDYRDLAGRIARLTRVETGG